MSAAFDAQLIQEFVGEIVADSYAVYATLAVLVYDSGKSCNSMRTIPFDSSLALSFDKEVRDNVVYFLFKLPESPNFSSSTSGYVTTVYPSNASNICFQTKPTAFVSMVFFVVTNICRHD